jgi:hypothetical protein
MFLFYVLSLFKKGDTIQGGILFKGGHYLRKYGTLGPICSRGKGASYSQLDIAAAFVEPVAKKLPY